MDTAATDSAKSVTVLVYALQALSLITAVTALVGVIINYVKLPDVRGTWLESHFRWQIRTFWFGLLWGLVGFVLLFVLVGWLILAVDFVWCIYRVVKGWLNLNDGKPMYVDNAVS